MKVRKASMDRACYTREVALETNEEGIRILKYDMCIWVGYKWVNKEKVKSQKREREPKLPE
jgi:hypothetical protein